MVPQLDSCSETETGGTFQLRERLEKIETSDLLIPLKMPCAPR